ncbi:MAG: chromate transporter [Spirochaetaceae bacterium]|jgi:chromate transporter|nr:chromate transporter [Spirochaetaceae bacterium]
MKEVLALYWTFFKIGSLTFGGGYAILPILERELIRKKGWTTMDEVMDYYTIAQVTPGVIAINISTFIGYKRMGIIGGVISTLGFVSPSCIIITLAAAFLNTYQELPWVQHAFAGIRVAVAALALDTVITMIRKFYRDSTAGILFAAALGLSAVFSPSPVLVVLGAGLAGFILYRGRGDPPKTGNRRGGTETDGGASRGEAGKTGGS